MTTRRETTANRIAREDREFEAARFAANDAAHDAHCRDEAIASGEFDPETNRRSYRIAQ
jgi:hypothetical protein